MDERTEDEIKKDHDENMANVDFLMSEELLKDDFELVKTLNDLPL